MSPVIWLRDKMASDNNYGWWSDFLETLSTRGGAIFVLLVMTVVFLLFLWHLLHYAEKEDAQVVTVVISAFSAFQGALLTLLTGQSRQQQNGGSNAGSVNVPQKTGTSPS